MGDRTSGPAGRRALRRAAGDSRRAFDGIPRSYVLCKRDRAIPPALQRRMLDQAGCTEVVELDTDHVPHLSATDELAEVLDRLATRMLPASAV